MDLLRLALGKPATPEVAPPGLTGLTTNGTKGSIKKAVKTSALAPHPAPVAAPPKATSAATSLRDAGLLDAEEQVAVAAMDTLAACLPGSVGNQVWNQRSAGRRRYLKVHLFCHRCPMSLHATLFQPKLTLTKLKCSSNWDPNLEVSPSSHDLPTYHFLSSGGARGSGRRQAGVRPPCL